VDECFGLALEKLGGSDKPLGAELNRLAANFSSARTIEELYAPLIAIENYLGDILQSIKPCPLLLKTKKHTTQAFKQILLFHQPLATPYFPNKRTAIFSPFTNNKTSTRENTIPTTSTLQLDNYLFFEHKESSYTLNSQSNIETQLNAKRLTHFHFYLFRSYYSLPAP